MGRRTPRLALRSLLLGALLASAPAAPPAFAAGSPLVLDTAHSSARFSVQHLVLTSVTGTIKIASVELTTQAGSPIPSAVNATLDAATIDTQEPQRDKALNGSDWLDTAAYPTIAFESTKIAGKDPNHFTIQGRLTLHGVTKPTVLEARYTGAVADASGRQHVGYAATGKIDRRDFNLNWSRIMPAGDPIVGNDVTLDLELEFVR